MTADDLERRVAELETMVERRTDPPATDAVETGGPSAGLSRRSLLSGLGVLGLGGYAAGSASADPQGQMGSADRPIRTVYTQRLAGGLTDGTAVSSLLGPGLTVDAERLRATVAGATTTGEGTELYTGLDGGLLQFRSLVGGSNVSLSSGNGELTIDAASSSSGGEDNTASNVGSGAGAFKQKSGTDLEFKSFVAGTNVTISPGTDTLTVDAAPSYPAVSDSGTEVVSGASDIDFDVDLSVTDDGDGTVTVDATGTGSPMDVSNDGTTVVTSTGDVDFRNSLSASSDGDGTATVDVSLSIADVLQNGASDGQVITWDGAAWKTAFPGTTTDTAFDLLAGGTRAIRLDPDGNSDEVNVVCGHPNNNAAALGATIGGGGLDANSDPNVVYDVGGTVGGGKGNQAGSNDGDGSTGREATVGGGLTNTASGSQSTVAGGYQNTGSGDFTAIAGGEQHTADGGKSFIGGGQGNTNSAYVGVIGGGLSNSLTADRTTIAGGENNGVSGKHGVVGGGYNNVVEGARGTIAGGGPSDTANPGSTNNAVYDDYGTIGGGGNNQAGSDDGMTNATYATVGGGLKNSATTRGGTVAGGEENTVKGADQATVGGGYQNTANGFRATVAGGFGNAASNSQATIAGGKSNNVPAGWATIGGGETNDAYDDYGTIAGGRSNQAGTSGTDTTNSRYATVGGGWYNQATAAFATIAGGGPSDTANPSKTNNTVSSDYGTVGGGAENLVVDKYGTIAGGGQNQAGSNDSTDNDQYATVGGGVLNTATGQDSTIAGGSGNFASGPRGTVGGGFDNSASGSHATVPGGRKNAATAAYSLAAGRVASADHAGAVVFGDSTTTTVSSSQADEFRSQMPMYAPSFNTTSARAKKTGIEPVGPSSVLDAVCEMDVFSWEFRETDDGRHIGPMAGDFHDAFGVGDGDAIATVDADGVALAAIKGLAERVDELESELAQKDDRIDDLVTTKETGADHTEELEDELDAKDERIDALEERLEAVEGAIGGCE